VIWRRLSFGSQSEAGSQFVARILTVITTLNVQGQDVLEFLTQVCKASRFGSPMPSLLPKARPLRGLQEEVYNDHQTYYYAVAIIQIRLFIPFRS
jgi:hypothetical protein